MGDAPVETLGHNPDVTLNDQPTQLRAACLRLSTSHTERCIETDCVVVGDYAGWAVRLLTGAKAGWNNPHTIRRTSSWGVPP